VTDQLNKIPAEDFSDAWRGWKHVLICVLHLMDHVFNK
jgi:hypothetical protein